jgi:hypothetical protein
MANKVHLKRLEEGIKAWNRWRDKSPGSIPNLSGAMVADKNLEGINFRGANLYGSYFLRSNLSGADLSGANLRDASLLGTNLRHAVLVYTDLRYAELSYSDLSGADIRNVNFWRAALYKANFTRAEAGYTIFDGINLSIVDGLEKVIHRAPSEISINTIYLSEGKIPEIFLRGCGVPEVFITQIPALVAAMQPIQFYSCFISYSSKDQKFAERLHADLQNKGVRCWYAPEDLKIGDRIRTGIDESIRIHDKLLLILSRNSIDSEWVEKEVETAMERERQQKRTILFPIRLDDTVLAVESGWAADIRRSRNIGDFHRWKSHDTYSKSFERLLRDLKA